MFKYVATAVLMLGIAGPLAAKPKECDPVLMDYQFCPKNLWQRMHYKNAPEGLFVWRTNRTAAKLIIEMIAVGSVPETEMVMDAIKDSVRQSLIDPSAVSFETAMFKDGDEQGLGTVIYEIMMEGEPVRVHHSVLISGNLMMQYITSTSNDNDQDGSETHRSFVTSFKTVEPIHDA